MIIKMKEAVYIDPQTSFFDFVTKFKSQGTVFIVFMNTVIIEVVFCCCFLVESWK